MSSRRDGKEEKSRKDWDLDPQGEKRDGHGDVPTRKSPHRGMESRGSGPRHSGREDHPGRSQEDPAHSLGILADYASYKLGKIRPDSSSKSSAEEEAPLVSRRRGRKPKTWGDGAEWNVDFPYVEAEGERTYSCVYPRCTKSFPSLSRMRRHYVIHTGKKPFACLNPECPKTFSRKDNMLQHHKGHCTYTKKDEHA
jgi:Zinc finger, C2H2 type